MLRRILPAMLLAVLLSGCFGHPAGSVQPGDLVDFNIRATHPQTGLLIVDANAADIPVGVAGSPFPPAVGRALIGASVNETVRVRTEVDPAVTFAQQQTVPRTLQVLPRSQTAQGNAQVGETRWVQVNAERGPAYAFTVAQTVVSVERRQAEATVTAHANGTKILEASGVADVTRLVDGSPAVSERPFSIVQNVTGVATFQDMTAGDTRAVPYEPTLVTVRRSVTDATETRKEAPGYGGYLVLEEDEDVLRIRIDPVEGFVWIVLGSQSPLGFPPGAMRVHEVREDEVVMAYSGSQFAGITGQAADVEFTISGIHTPEVESDNHAVGHSPVLKSPRPPAAAATDGHTDHTH